MLAFGMMFVAEFLSAESVGKSFAKAGTSASDGVSYMQGLLAAHVAALDPREVRTGRETSRELIDCLLSVSDPTSVV